LLVAFAIVFAGIVFALAIAFGLGARDMARQWLEAKVRSSVAEEEVFRHL
jgi:ABC-type phosphate/phosphonate transport system permease subunit